jgi:glycosyltransferase involved in cell wall biosynthesis
MVNQLLPFVSVIMPIRNEADFIAQSLAAVLNQDYPHDRMEILIADGISTDDTRRIIQRLTTTTSIPVCIIDNPKQIVPTGMNLAIAQARGEIIVRVDGHCEIAPDYVSRCVYHLRTSDVGGVGGPIETINQGFVGEAIALAMTSGFGVGGSAFRVVKDKTMYADTIAFPAYWRSSIDAAGLYDEELIRNQDDEYNYRLRGLGYKLLLAPDIRSRYYSRSSLKKLACQYYQYGMFKVRVLQKHPRQMQPRQFAPPLFAAGVFGGLMIAPFSRTLRQIWLGALALYLVINMIVSVRMAVRSGLRYLPLLPVVFATLHLSYGIGFWRGMIRFWKQWK